MSENKNKLRKRKEKGNKKITVAHHNKKYTN
jgi:hypothetical protein